MKTRYIIFAAVLLLAVLQGTYYYSRLPETVASHFDGVGQPNDWMSKPAFAGFMLGIVLLMAFSFAVLPIFLVRLPASAINMPNKDYWLAPPRRAQTNAAIRCLMLEMGVATLVLIIGVNQLAIQANFQTAPHLPMTPFWIFLAAYLVFTGIWILRLYRRFSKVA